MLEFSESSQGCEARLAGPEWKGKENSPDTATSQGTEAVAKLPFPEARSPRPSRPRHLMRGRQQVRRQRYLCLAGRPAGRWAGSPHAGAPQPFRAALPRGVMVAGGAPAPSQLPEKSAGTWPECLNARELKARGHRRLAVWPARPPSPSGGCLLPRHRLSPCVPRADLGWKQEGFPPLPPFPLALRASSLDVFCPGSTAGACPAPPGGGGQRRQG